MDGCENPNILNKVDYFLRILQQNHPNITVEGVKVWSSNRGKYYCTMKVILPKVQD